MNWLNILIASFIGACLLGLCGFTVDFCRTVPSLVRRRERKQLTRFRRNVENEIPPNKIKTCVAWFPGIWELIYPMKPGVWRDKWKSNLLQEMERCDDRIRKGHMAAYLTSPIYQQTERLRFWVKSTVCPVCNTPMHIVYQAYYGGFDIASEGLVALFPVNEKEQTVVFENWLAKDRNQLPVGTHLDHCQNCQTLYPLEKELFTEQHEISPYRFLQDFTLILPDGKRVSFAETQVADNAGKGAGE